MYEAASAGFADVCELLIKWWSRSECPSQGQERSETHCTVHCSSARSIQVCSTPATICMDADVGRTRRNGSVVSRGSSNSDSGSGGGCCVVVMMVMLNRLIKTKKLVCRYRKMKFNHTACPPHFSEERF